jgi:predicted nucleic acid-binding protein
VKLVSNASPLILLARCALQDVLPRIASEVLVPEEVFSEVAGMGNDLPGARALREATWLRVQSCSQRRVLNEWREQFRHLGAGEIATVLLAKELNADVALIDDRRGRQLAEANGIRVLGTIGLLEVASEKSFIPDLRATYSNLLREGMFIDKRLLNLSLKRFNLPSL